jgi:hypothetical protein
MYFIGSPFPHKTSTWFSRISDCPNSFGLLAWTSYSFCFVKFRCQYLSNGVLQAKNANNSDGLVGSTQSSSDTGLLDMLEGKLAVLRFQIKIKEELEAMASSSEVLHSTSNSVENGLVPEASSTVDANFANAAREKANELSSDLKSITQLYNEYAVPFKLWEVLFSLSGSVCVCRFVQLQIFLFWLLTLFDNEHLGVLQSLLSFGI